MTSFLSILRTSAHLSFRTALDRDLKSRRMLAAASALMTPPPFLNVNAAAAEFGQEEGGVNPPAVPPSPAARAASYAKSLSQWVVAAVRPSPRPAAGAPPPRRIGEEGATAGDMVDAELEWENEDEGPSAEQSLAAAQQV